MRTLVLASASPRRAELLSFLGVTFVVRPADLDESAGPGEPAPAYVERVARAKAAAAARAGEVVLAADTTVELEDAILGKPNDPSDAAVMLRRLSGRSHLVHTAVAVTVTVTPGVGAGVGAVSAVATKIVSTKVRFARLSARDIEWYVATGEPLDKAGAYGLQGIGGAFVESIEGSWSNVVGLPLVETAALLRGAGVAVLGAATTG